MNKIFEKSIGLLNNKQLNELNNSLIIIFGMGGVGGYTFEGLVRAGIGNFAIIDKDKFELTNFNRQLASNSETINKYKVDVYLDRAKKINDDINIISIKENICNTNINAVFDIIFNNFKNNGISIKSDFTKFNLQNGDKSVFKLGTHSNQGNNNNIYVIDCIDDIDAKISIIKYCKNNALNIISCMGTANHISSKNIKITDISKTKYCPIAKKIRLFLKNEKISNVDCLYFDEEPIKIEIKENEIIRHTSTISYIPAIAGLKISEYVISTILI